VSEGFLLEVDCSHNTTTDLNTPVNDQKRLDDQIIAHCIIVDKINTRKEWAKLLTIGEAGNGQDADGD
jgi:hypothetical protein